MVWLQGKACCALTVFFLLPFTGLALLGFSSLLRPWVRANPLSRPPPPPVPRKPMPFPLPPITNSVPEPAILMASFEDIESVLDLRIWDMAVICWVEGLAFSGLFLTVFTTVLFSFGGVAPASLL